MGKSISPSIHELLEGFDCEINEELLICMIVSDNDVFRAKKMYHKWDVVKVYELDAYIKAIKYTPDD